MTLRMPPALPPVNVRITYEDGSVVPVDCIYVGWEVDFESHLWAINNPRPTEKPGNVLVDKLPAYTAITITGESQW